MGLLFAAPALRVQSFYLGFVTLSAALVFPEMLVAFSDVTNGINGIALRVPALTHDRVRGPELDLASSPWRSPALSLLFHAWFRDARHWDAPCASRRSAPRRP